ncbi:MAG: hypothetical protein JSW39_10040 [Desulfobacterales bacterium]|nr:MAG: hypothetical protein JSW39_10040 [Desulfobacterales bacterium]
MIHCFYISACLGLIIFQTTVMPNLPLLDRFYDLLLPFVIYVGASRPVRESLIFVLFVGFLMDSLSGSPFGVYLTTYLWLLIGVEFISKFLRLGNRLLLALLVLGGVIIENIIFIGIWGLLGSGVQYPSEVTKRFVIQLLAAIGTGPFLLWALSNGQKRVEKWQTAVFAQRDKPGT